VTWAMVEAEGWASKAGSKWKSIPDLMFRYRSAMFLARLYCPEVLLGMHSVDELHDIQPIDVTPKPSLADPVRISSTETEEIDKIAEELSQAQAETTVEPDTDPEPDGRPEPTKEPTPQDRFYNQLGHACDGDEGNMLNLLRSLTGNHGLELCMIQDFEDNSIGILEDKLSDYLSGQEANNA